MITSDEKNRMKWGSESDAILDVGHSDGTINVVVHPDGSVTKGEV